MAPRNGKSRLLNECGSTAVVFALAAAGVLVTMAGAIELTRINEVKAKLAAITDASALAGKRAEQAATGLSATAARTAGETAATNYFNTNVGQLSGLATNFSISKAWDTDGALRVTGRANATLSLGASFGLTSMGSLASIPVSTVSVALVGSDKYLEIALVLDNTGSMFSTDGRPQTRFTLLRQAATEFVNSAFDSAADTDKIRIAVIPWATTVNIKSEEPKEWDRSAVATSVIPDRGTRQLPTNTINRNGDLYENGSQRTNLFAPVEWRGCVSGDGETIAPTDADKPVKKWHVLATPSLLYGGTWLGGTNVNTTCTYCPPPPPGPPYYSPPSPPGGMIGENRPQNNRNTRMAARNAGRFTVPMAQTKPNGISHGDITNVQSGCSTYACVQLSCNPESGRVNKPSCGQDTMKYYGGDPYTRGRRNTYVPTNQKCLPYTGWCTLSAYTENNFVACVADPNEITWNNGGGAWCSWVPTTNWTTFDPTTGPNINCPMPMLGLSGNRAQVLETINRMSPVPGGTHADVGLRWGARALSPSRTWQKFFGLGESDDDEHGNRKRPRNWRAPDVKKAVILITDGENTQAEDFPGFWNCSDTSAGCTGTINNTELNSRMIAWCNKLNTDWGTDVYTVAVNVNNPTALTLLRQCAGSPDRAFSGDASQLTASLRAVGAQLFKLHLKE